MIRISFTAQSDRVVAAALRARGPAIVAALMRSMNESMLMLQQRIQRKLSGQVLKQRSGKLIGSINMQPASMEGNTIVGSVTGAGGPAFYGRFHEYGTGPYVIVPKNAKALRFTIRGGRVIFATRVNHPGLKARPFMSTSLEELRDRITKKIQDAARKAALGE